MFFFDGPKYNVQTRSDAITLCYANGHHIANPSQLLVDAKDGHSGYGSCGWTWARNGRQHVHCLELTDDGKECKPGKSELR